MVVTTQNRNVKYPWPIWEDGKEHTIEWQANFTCNPPSMIALLHQRAKNKPYLSYVTTSLSGTTITFSFTRSSNDEN